MGQVQGDVHCVALVLGENVQLEGNVVAEDVMVRGRLIGSVRALKVVLQSTAHVEGNLVHKSLAVEHGTHFEGESRPSENPLASNPQVPGVELRCLFKAFASPHDRSLSSFIGGSWRMRQLANSLFADQHKK
jgi:cytoskeletal protein CcmA (bactofilin family)